MKRFAALAMFAVAVVGSSGTADAQIRARAVVRPRADARQVEAILRVWPERPRAAAEKLIGAYGQPHEATASRLTWHQNGPWKRTVVTREETPHNFPRPHTDFVEQTVDLRVPLERFDEIAAYNGSVLLDRTRGEVTARGDGEETNFVILNLVSDLATGKLDADQARRRHALLIGRALRGMRELYAQGLQFAPMRNRAADMDVEVAVQEAEKPFLPPAEPGGQPPDDRRPLLPPTTPGP